MSIDVRVKCGKSNSTILQVERNRAARVTVTGVPPADDSVFLRPFAEFLTNSAGSEDMRVVGSSAAPLEFFIQAGSQGDRYVNTLAFTIADASASLNEFGNLNTALANGCQLVYEDPEFGDVVIADALQTNFDFVQLCNFEPMFGTGSDAFKAANVQGASEAYIPILDMEDVFGLQYGLKLEKNSVKKLKIVIRDDVTGIDRFDVKAFGFDRLERDE